MPGHLRWGLLEPFSVGRREGSTPGQIFDTGRGWPAARFRHPVDADPIADQVEIAAGATIPGWLVHLSPPSVAALLDHLDQVEGAVAADTATNPDHRVPSLATGDYRRIRISADDGTEAWAYEAVVVGAGWHPVQRWSGSAEN